MSTRLGAGRGRAFGSGWISGVLSVMLAGLAYGGVLCLLFPDALTTPAARPLDPMGLVHALIFDPRVGTHRDPAWRCPRRTTFGRPSSPGRAATRLGARLSEPSGRGLRAPA